MTRFPSRTASAPLALLALAAALALALLQLSCSSASLTPVADPMPAARAGLRPEYRVFYDELRDYGDWVLIEPYGFVFRPKTRFATWSPYNDGFWSPSDSYGWVWVSGEPFGWATYHYGAWLNDSYQGYVWVPGLEWAPAWVAWSSNQDYVGWAALTPSGTPASNFSVVPRANLGATNLSTFVLPPEKAVAAIKNAEPVQNLTDVDHVTVNRGPSIGWVEQAAGPLQRARVEDISSRRELGRVTASPAPSAPGSQSAPSAHPTTSGLPAREFRQATESAAAQTRSVMQQKAAAPEVITRIRLTDVPSRPGTAPASKPGWKRARPDSAR